MSNSKRKANNFIKIRDRKARKSLKLNNILQIILEIQIIQSIIQILRNSLKVMKVIYIIIMKVSTNLKKEDSHLKEDHFQKKKIIKTNKVVNYKVNLIKKENQINLNSLRVIQAQEALHLLIPQMILLQILLLNRHLLDQKELKRSIVRTKSKNVIYKKRVVDTQVVIKAKRIENKRK